MDRSGIYITIVLLIGISSAASTQSLQKSGDSVVLANEQVRVVVNTTTGKTSYRFSGGARFDNAIAYVDEIKAGYLASTNFSKHSYTIDPIKDPLGKGSCINLVHEDDNKPLKLIQHITLYENRAFVLLSAEAEAATAGGLVETRNISPLSILPAAKGQCYVPGTSNQFIDYPFDNDNWVDVIAQQWPTSANAAIRGTSYELAAVQDAANHAGFVTGSLTHDCWKTGIRYASSATAGSIDSLIVYGGAAVGDNPSLPASFGGRDGTHDYMAHGTIKGESVQSPLIYLSASADVRKTLVEYGQVNTTIAGALQWNKSMPVYWNSFGVEGVLGYEKVMMPADVAKISDYLHSLDQFNRYSKPVLSIDSYDQGIYTTDVLSAVSRYGKKKGQQMGFYFGPFVAWTWKNSVEQSKLPGVDVYLRDVVLRDAKYNPIPYKDGDWAAYPLDPTHPGVRAYIVSQLQKAKAVDAKFIKIDFLPAGALEAATHYDPAVRTGMQAYNQGMKLFKKLVDSIMGPDIFITMAISPLFPHQYAHTRFISTDVYSHLRNDQPGFPNWGSTSASMISASHLWWVQGTLWPCTNMDVLVMKNFQKNPDLSEQEVKVRLFSLITLGSLLGDGSDFRHKLAAERGRKFLNNPSVCAFFDHPKAFTPLRQAEGNSPSQQLSFFLPGDTLLVSAFNFDKDKIFKETFRQSDIGWSNASYSLQDFMTGTTIAKIEKGATSFVLEVQPKDALLIKLVPVKE